MRTLRPLVFLLLAGCGGDSPPKDRPTTRDPGTTPSTPVVPTCSPRANLALVTLDGWARPTTPTVTWSHPIPFVDGLAPMGDAPVDLGITLQLEDHLDARITVSYDGGASGESFAVETDENTLWAGGWTDGECPTYTIYAGQAHAWFATSAMAPGRNDVTFLMDGEQAWPTVYDDLQTATRSVTWATWFWQSDFGLLRSANSTQAQRDAVTALTLLEDLRGVSRRVLVNRFWGENLDFTEVLTTDSALLAHAETANDDFEVMLQGNETEAPFEAPYPGRAAPVDFVARVRGAFPDDVVTDGESVPAAALTLDAASFHQKFIVIDDRVAFVGGMNTKLTDWDTSEHRVFEPLRMGTDASDQDRQDVADKLALPDTGPRKDYMARIEGPAVHAVQSVFDSRWSAAIAEGVPYSSNATPLSLSAPLPDVAGGVQAQIAQTLPEPWADQSILELHARAFAQATDYIFIEDQYFRAPLLNQVILERMLEEPDLVLIVITKPVSELDPGLKYTYLSDELFTAMFPDRYQVLQLVSFDLVTDPGILWDTVDFYELPIDVHSKLRFVDDRFTSLGSCNFNNRGYLYEGEMVVSVLDEAWTTDARRQVFENLVGPAWASQLSDDAQNNFDVLAAAAADNAAIAQWWRDNAPSDAADADAEWAVRQPSGFVMPVGFSFDYIEVGPDLF